MSTIEAQRPETIQITIPVLAAEQQARQSEALDPQTVSTLKESLFDEVKFALSQSKDTSYTMPDYQQALIAQIRHELAAADGKEFTDDQILAVINAKLGSSNKQERRTWEEIGDRVIKQQIADLQAYAQAQIDYKPAPQEKFESRKTKIAQTANTGQKVEQKMKTSGPWYKFGRGKGTAYGEVQINFGGKKGGIFGKNYTNIAQFNESTQLDKKTDRARRVCDRYGLANGEIIPPQKMKMMEQVLIKQITALQDVSVRRHGGSISDENGFSFVKSPNSQNTTEYQTTDTSRPKVNLQIEGLQGSEAFPVDFSDKPEEQLKLLTEFLNKITLEKVAEIESGKHQKARIDAALIIAENEAKEEIDTSKPKNYDTDVRDFLSWGLQEWEIKTFDEIKTKIQGENKWDLEKEETNKTYFLEMQEYAKKFQKKQSAIYRAERISQAIATLYPVNTQDTEKLLGRASLGVISEKVHPANIRFQKFRNANPNFPPAYLHIAYVLMGEGVFEPNSDGRALLQKVNKIITPQELFAFLDEAKTNDKSIYDLKTSETTDLLKKITPEKIKEIFAYIKTRAEQGFNGSEAEELAGLELRLDGKGGYQEIGKIELPKEIELGDSDKKNVADLFKNAKSQDGVDLTQDEKNKIIVSLLEKFSQLHIGEYDELTDDKLKKIIYEMDLKTLIIKNGQESEDDYPSRLKNYIKSIAESTFYNPEKSLDLYVKDKNLTPNISKSLNDLLEYLANYYTIEGEDKRDEVAKLFMIALKYAATDEIENMYYELYKIVNADKPFSNPLIIDLITENSKTIKDIKENLDKKNKLKDLINKIHEYKHIDIAVTVYDQALLHLQPGTQMVQEIMQATGLPLEKACQVVYGIAEKRKKTIEQTQ